MNLDFKIALTLVVLASSFLMVALLARQGTDARTVLEGFGVACYITAGVAAVLGVWSPPP